jgi:hypothetical protein
MFSTQPRKGPEQLHKIGAQRLPQAILMGGWRAISIGAASTVSSYAEDRLCGCVPDPAPGQGGHFTFWDYFGQAFANNRGIRIDHFLLSPELAERLCVSRDR